MQKMEKRLQENQRKILATSDDEESKTNSKGGKKK
jgi:hypothetical protein